MKDYERLTPTITKRLNGDDDTICAVIGPFLRLNFAKVYNRLAELEDEIEDGTLVRLPCKVGDTVYRLFDKCDGHQCPYNGDYGQWRCNYKGKRMCDSFVDEIQFELSDLSDFGKNIFLTKEEAEARLKELQGEEK